MILVLVGTDKRHFLKTIVIYASLLLRNKNHFHMFDVGLTFFSQQFLQLLRITELHFQHFISLTNSMCVV